MSETKLQVALSHTHVWVSLNQDCTFTQLTIKQVVRRGALTKALFGVGIARLHHIPGSPWISCVFFQRILESLRLTPFTQNLLPTHQDQYTKTHPTRHRILSASNTSPEPLSHTKKVGDRMTRASLYDPVMLGFVSPKRGLLAWAFCSWPCSALFCWAPSTLRRPSG